MQMNQSQQVEAMRKAAAAYVEAVDVPPYAATVVESRRRDLPVVRRVTWRPAAALVAAIIAVALILNGRAVLAQVEHMLQAFASINGQNVPVAVSTVSLEQARRDMPFAVIAPAGFPAGLDVAINELNFSSSRFDSRLVVQFRNGDHVTPLTIIESSARGKTPSVDMRLWMTQSTKGVLPAAPPALPAAGSNHAFYQFNSGNGRVMRRFRAEPITWTVRGTQIDLISPPGLLTSTQLAAIRRAMSF
jgi:hypothetical protein